MKHIDDESIQARLKVFPYQEQRDYVLAKLNYECYPCKVTKNILGKAEEEFMKWGLEHNKFVAKSLNQPNPTEGFTVERFLKRREYTDKFIELLMRVS